MYKKDVDFLEIVKEIANSKFHMNELLNNFALASHLVPLQTIHKYELKDWTNTSDQFSNFLSIEYAAASKLQNVIDAFASIKARVLTKNKCKISRTDSALFK